MTMQKYVELVMKHGNDEICIVNPIAIDGNEEEVATIIFNARRHVINQGDEYDTILLEEITGEYDGTVKTFGQATEELDARYINVLKQCIKEGISRDIKGAEMRVYYNPVKSRGMEDLIEDLKNRRRQLNNQLYEKQTSLKYMQIKREVDVYDAIINAVTPMTSLEELLEVVREFEELTGELKAREEFKIKK